jgi:hypothetical protein
MDDKKDMLLKNIEILSTLMTTHKIAFGINMSIQSSNKKPTTDDIMLFTLLDDIDKVFNETVEPLINNFNSDVAIKDLLDDINDN